MLARGQLAGATVERDPALLQAVDPIGDRERLADVLLDHEHGRCRCRRSRGSAA